MVSLNVNQKIYQVDADPPKQNGGRSKSQLIDHMANDGLVGWGWHPGDGRTFVAQVRLWIAKGAYAPSVKKK